jgi:hypothetical protein
VVYLELFESQLKSSHVRLPPTGLIAADEWPPMRCPIDGLPDPAQLIQKIGRLPASRQPIRLAPQGGVLWFPDRAAAGPDL